MSVYNVRTDNWIQQVQNNPLKIELQTTVSCKNQLNHQIVLLFRYARNYSNSKRRRNPAPRDFFDENPAALLTSQCALEFISKTLESSPKPWTNLAAAATSDMPGYITR